MRALSPATIGLCGLLVAPVLAAIPLQLLDGSPTINPKSRTAAYVWRDAQAFHVRFTSDRGTTRFHGKVCSTGRVVRLDFVTLQRQESAAIGPTQHCVGFSADVSDSVDGFDFQTDAPVATIEISRDGQLLSRSSIRLGARAVPAPANPLIYDARRRQPPARDRAPKQRAPAPSQGQAQGAVDQGAPPR